jgi:hypothetical protein
MDQTQEAVKMLTASVLQRLDSVRESAASMSVDDQQLGALLVNVDAAEEHFKMLLNVLYR